MTAGAEAPAGWFGYKVINPAKFTPLGALLRKMRHLHLKVLLYFSPGARWANFTPTYFAVETWSPPLHRTQKPVKGACLEVEESRDLTPHLHLSTRCVVEAGGIEPPSNKPF